MVHETRRILYEKLYLNKMCIKKPVMYWQKYRQVHDPGIKFLRKIFSCTSQFIFKEKLTFKFTCVTHNDSYISIK